MKLVYINKLYVFVLLSCILVCKNLHKWNHINVSFCTVIIFHSILYSWIYFHWYLRIRSRISLHMSTWKHVYSCSLSHTTCNSEKVKTTQCRGMDELEFVRIIECQSTVKANDFCIFHSSERLREMTNVTQMVKGNLNLNPGLLGLSLVVFLLTLYFEIISNLPKNCENNTYEEFCLADYFLTFCHFCFFSLSLQFLY